MARRHTDKLRRLLSEMLEEGPSAGRGSSIVTAILVSLVVINLLALVLESVPEIGARFHVWFVAIELLSLLVFTAEYLARLWVSAEYASPHRLTVAQARLRFVRSPAGLIDLLAVLPFWLALFWPVDLRVMLVARAVRFLKLARYSPAMRSLIEVLHNERRALFGCMVIMVGATLIAACLMYIAERHAQPDKLGTIPDAMWWAIVTLGTIGYGDVVPVTAAGKLIASFTIFTGLVMVALPVGIIATSFADVVHRREFVVTWNMVARVPLFSGLEAADIGHIMQLLRAQTVDAGGIIARRGDRAYSMYFIAAGEVEIQLKGETVRLGPGHFFGEIAVLRRARRSATVSALSRVNLLVLDAHDLHTLMEREPQVAVRMNEVVSRRLGRELVTPAGDLVTEEIADGEDSVTPDGRHATRPGARGHVK